MNVSYGEVERPAIAISKSERRPTVETVHEALGRGSPDTLGSALKRFWRDLGVRMEGDLATLTSAANADANSRADSPSNKQERGTGAVVRRGLITEVMARDVESWAMSRHSA